MIKRFKLNPKVASFSDATMGISLPNTNGFVDIDTASSTRTTLDAINNNILMEIEIPDEPDNSGDEDTTKKLSDPNDAATGAGDAAKANEGDGGDKGKADDDDDDELSKSEMLEALKPVLSKDEYKDIQKADSAVIKKTYKNKFPK